MKKLTFLFVFFLASFFKVITFNGCSEDDIINNNPVVSTKGVFVLYEGVFGQASSCDYGFIDIVTDSVFSNVFQNSNNGSNLNAFPDGLLMDGSVLYIVAQGSFGQPGSIYKINSTSNQLISSRASFGRNPYSLAKNDNKLFITNIAGSFVSVMDLNLNPVNDSIEVGPNPSEIASLHDKIYVSKASYTSEKSLAVISTSDYQVDKIFFTSAPVAVTNNSGSIFVSSYTHKKIYEINLATNTLMDSSETIPTTFPAITEIVPGDNNTLFVVTYDTASFSTKEVFKYDIPSKSVSLFVPLQGGPNDIYGLAFDKIENKLYVANSKGGAVNGEVRVYNIGGNLIHTYSNIGGKYPRRISFKY